MPETPSIRVVHIASGDLWAGAEVQLFTLVKALKNSTNTDIHVFVMNHGTLEQKLIAENIPVIVFDESTLSSTTLFFRILQNLKRIRPDVVHTHREKENVLGSIACLIAGNIPSIRTSHGAPEHHPTWRQFSKRLANTVDWLCGRLLQKKVIAVSEDLLEVLKKKFPESKICVIENGLDIKALEQFKNTDKTTRHKQPYKIGLIGRLVPVKRVDLFIKLAKFMREHHPDFQAQYHIYGDGPLRDELMDLSRRHNVENIVHFEGHCPNIHTLMASLDTLLITSDHEGLPMTLLEAMALDIPIVARSVGGITTACQEGQGCWLIRSDSIEMFAKTLIECLSNHDARQQKCILAEQHVRQKYASSTNAILVNNIYIQLAKISP